MIELKTEREIELIRKSGRVVRKLLDELSKLIRPGIKTKVLDDAAREFFREAGATAAFLGYRGYPAAICVSVNEEVVHGIPGERVIAEGDLVSIDAGAVMEGYYGDAAITVGVGKTSQRAQNLIETTRKALDAGIGQAVEGNRLSDVSHAIQETVEQAKFGVVREFVGHGIGKAMHEEPPIPNFGQPNMGPRLRAGMVLAIEPMVTMGGFEVDVLGDGWTAVTKDKSLAAHFEHTIAITKNGAAILTRRQNG